METSYNGVVEEGTSAPTRKKVTRSTNKDSVLAKELEEERKRNASLLGKLRKAKSDNKRLEQSLGERSYVRLHSTLRDDNIVNDHSSVLMSSMSNLSFASLHVPECKPGDGEEEIDRKSFEQWKHMLEASMQLAGVTDETTKMNIFTIKAGPKLLDILEGTVSNSESADIITCPYTNAMHRLNTFFDSRDYIFMQRQKLRSLSQNPGESDVKYVKRVVAVAKLCDFSDSNLAEQVADSIQMHALNLKVREAGRKILRKGGSLAELLDKVRALEMEKLNEDLFAKTHHDATQLSVATVSSTGQRFQSGRNSGFGIAKNQGYVQQYQRGSNRESSYMRNRPNMQRAFSGSRGSGRGGRGFGRRDFVRNATSRTQCWRCMSRQHRPSECYAIDQICRNCHIKGHFERACHQEAKVQSAGTAKRRYSNDTKESSTGTKKIASVKGEDEVDESNSTNTFSLGPDTTNIKIETTATDAPLVYQTYYKAEELLEAYDNNVFYNDVTDSKSILNFGEVPRKCPNDGIIKAFVAGVKVPFLIDSGAEVNTIGSDTFNILMHDESAKLEMFCVKEGGDKPLKAYAMTEEIKVVATFVAELVISDDRPRYMEKFYAVENARALLGRSTALRYSVLQLGLNVPIRSESYFIFPGEIRALSVKQEFPKFNIAPVIINYDESMPPSRKIYTNIPPAFRSETERRLNDLLESGIIERVTDDMDKSYCSSLLVVPKGKNDIRLVVDLRGPNKAIIRSPFKMPTLECIMTDLPNCTWFSTIDMTSAFFHVELDPRSRHLTNFFAGNGMYRFKRLPFGLTNAPDIFQETLQTVVLAGCKGVRNYLDDVLVFGITKDEHDENLKAVMARLREHNVCINEEKSVFAQKSVKFLGFEVSEDGLKVEEDKLKAIKEFRRPENQQEVKSFLGLMNFMERFILHRADITEHLRELAKSDCFYWNDELEKEFKFMQEKALDTISKLGYFDTRAETEIYVDASPIGLGAVLVQFNEDKVPRIISCASKALTESERKYPQTQKEALAIVWGIERFTFYLTGKQFVVRADSEANEFIFGEGVKASRRSVSRAESWALRLQAYDFTVKRVPGDSNLADALSRLISKSQVDEPFDEDDGKHLLYSLDVGLMNITWHDIQTESETDAELYNVREAIKSGSWPKEYARYESQSKSFRVFGELLFKEDKIVLPSVLRIKAMQEAHQGHIGCPAMKRILRDYFWWPGISSEVEKFVKNCETCTKIARKNPPIPLSCRQLPEGPWEILQVDFLTVHGCGYGEFMVVVDTYSRFISVVEMKSTDATNTNNALQKIFFTWGLPLVLQSDNGPPFQSSEFVEFWETKGVKIRKSIPLCPQTNGAVERQNQGITKALKAARLDGISWRKALQDYVHFHNTMKPHARLDITPFELLVGRKYRGMFPALWDSKLDEVDREDIREKDATTKAQSKMYADSRRGAKPSDIAAGDVVLVAITRRNKLEPTFSTERYTVLSRDGAKVVIRSKRGVQYTRCVQDLKRAPVLSNDDQMNPIQDQEQIPDGCSTEEIEQTAEPINVRRPPKTSKPESTAQVQDSGCTSITESEQALKPAELDGMDLENSPGISPKEISEHIPKSTGLRPQRSLKKPKKFEDMFLYRIYE